MAPGARRTLAIAGPRPPGATAAIFPMNGRRRGVEAFAAGVELLDVVDELLEERCSAAAVLV